LVDVVQLGQLFAHAEHLLQVGDLKRAEDRCSEILAMNAGYPPALHLSGIIAFKAGDLNRAIERLQRACETKNAPAVYSSNLAEVLRHSGKLSEAEAAARQAIAIDDKTLGAWNNLGIILQESGRPDESRQCFERVLRKDPNNAQVHNNLGTVFKRLGQLERAEAHWKRASSIAPNFSTPATNLSSLYKEWDEIDKAVEYGRKAIAGKPVLIDSYLNLAAAESARSNFPTALKLLDRAARLSPRDPHVQSNRATVLCQYGRLDEALECIQRTIALTPDYGGAHFTHATILKALGRNTEALAAFEQAAQLPNTIREDILIGHAALLGEIGRNDEALAAVEKILMEFPSSASAHILRSDMIRFTAADPEIPAMQSLLESKDLRYILDRTLLNFALGKAFLDVGDSAAAFRHLDEGNRLKRNTFAYDSGATAAWMKSIAAVSSREAVESLGRSGFHCDTPIFVIGMPRSGTTLIEQIIASHSSVFGAGELGYVKEIVDRSGGLPDLMTRIDPDALAEMGLEYVSRLRKLAGDEPRVVDKMPSNFLYAGFIHMILPDAKMIHVVRDPVDTCFSCYTKLFLGDQRFSYDLSEIAQFYKNYETLMGHWRQTIASDNLLEVQYENVVADLEGQARRILEFLSLPWEASVLEFHRSDRVVRTSSLNQVRRPLYGTAIGRWQRHAAHLKPLLAGLGVNAPV
jgi:tetratricopeptide (TPR) repeat protein